MKFLTNLFLIIFFYTLCVPSSIYGAKKEEESPTASPSLSFSASSDELGSSPSLSRLPSHSLSMSTSSTSSSPSISSTPSPSESPTTSSLSTTPSTSPSSSPLPPYRSSTSTASYHGKKPTPIEIHEEQPEKASYGYSEKPKIKAVPRSLSSPLYPSSEFNQTLSSPSSQSLKTVSSSSPESVTPSSTSTPILTSTEFSSFEDLTPISDSSVSTTHLRTSRSMPSFNLPPASLSITHSQSSSPSVPTSSLHSSGSLPDFSTPSISRSLAMEDEEKTLTNPFSFLKNKELKQLNNILSHPLVKEFENFEQNDLFPDNMVYFIATDDTDLYLKARIHYNNFNMEDMDSLLWRYILSVSSSHDIHSIGYLIQELSPKVLEGIFQNLMIYLTKSDESSAIAAQLVRIIECYQLTHTSLIWGSEESIQKFLKFIALSFESHHPFWALYSYLYDARDWYVHQDRLDVHRFSQIRLLQESLKYIEENIDYSHFFDLLDYYQYIPALMKSENPIAKKIIGDAQLKLKEDDYLISLSVPMAIDIIEDKMPLDAAFRFMRSPQLFIALANTIDAEVSLTKSPTLGADGFSKILNSLMSSDLNDCLHDLNNLNEEHLRAGLEIIKAAKGLSLWTELLKSVYQRYRISTVANLFASCLRMLYLQHFDDFQKTVTDCARSDPKNGKGKLRYLYFLIDETSFEGRSLFWTLLEKYIPLTSENLFILRSILNQWPCRLDSINSQMFIFLTQLFKYYELNEVDEHFPMLLIYIKRFCPIKNKDVQTKLITMTTELDKSSLSTDAYALLRKWENFLDSFSKPQIEKEKDLKIEVTSKDPFSRGLSPKGILKKKDSTSPTSFQTEEKEKKKEVELEPKKDLSVPKFKGPRRSGFLGLKTSLSDNFSSKILSKLLKTPSKATEKEKEKEKNERAKQTSHDKDKETEKKKIPRSVSFALDRSKMVEYHVDEPPQPFWWKKRKLGLKEEQEIAKKFITDYKFKVLQSGIDTPEHGSINKYLDEFLDNSHLGEDFYVEAIRLICEELKSGKFSMLLTHMFSFLPEFLNRMTKSKVSVSTTGLGKIENSISSLHTASHYSELLQRLKDVQRYR